MVGWLLHLLDDPMGINDFWGSHVLSYTRGAQEAIQSSHEEWGSIIYEEGTPQPILMDSIDSRYEKARTYQWSAGCYTF